MTYSHEFQYCLSKNKEVYITYFIPIYVDDDDVSLHACMCALVLAIPLQGQIYQVEGK